MRNITLHLLLPGFLVCYLITLGGITQGGPNDLPIQGIGCWVQKTSTDNPFIYSDTFDWYVTDMSNMKFFINKNKKPLFISHAGEDPDILIEGIDKYKDKIVGALWDWEFTGMSQDTAESSLKKVYEKAKKSKLLFGIVIRPGIKQNLKSGIDLTRAHSYADFIMPMMYAQWFGMKRSKIEQLLYNERKATKLPIVAVLTIESTMTKPPRKLTPQEIISLYKGLGVDGFCVWNVRDLNADYIRSISALK